ncbi:class I SAM-dependent methyltransferase [Antrihabitans sp. YC3-6]|uniref:Class I SAM-dependent methyltransferase n=1 Tax=Antrihabitans stalagmiti TaxID=2799499 RepID=A0A934U2Y8_9NOCA|nr:class I SAM-dependent methyltransferase [Antrihabitans stalagmiti]MBJ8339137.1 class I SAM-dependent methyltransferase [Antrihabitans stalagmiti]
MFNLSDDERVSKNQETLAAYEAIALEYAQSTEGSSTTAHHATMQHFVDSLSPGDTVLELGSGPGWDADFVESFGTRVRRTDATAAFREFQVARGKHIEPLDAVNDAYVDPIWPAYDAVMALYVLQHIEREDNDTVLRKVAEALRPGGRLLVTVREGSGDLWEGTSGNRYHVTRWEPSAFEARVEAAALEPVWTDHFVDEEGPWLALIARKPLS